MSNMCRKDVGGFYEPCKAGLREFLLERVRALKAVFNVIAGRVLPMKQLTAIAVQFWENELSYFKS